MSQSAYLNVAAKNAFMHDHQICGQCYLFILQHVFVAYDDENVYTYVHYRDTVQGKMVCVACRWWVTVDYMEAYSKSLSPTTVWSQLLVQLEVGAEIHVDYVQKMRTEQILVNIPTPPPPHIHIHALSLSQGPMCEMAGVTKLPFGHHPLMLYNGEVSCQTLTGKISIMRLNTHIFSDDQEITEEEVCT